MVLVLFNRTYLGTAATKRENALFDIVSLSPVKSNHRQAPGVMNTSQPRLSVHIDSAGLENGDAKRSPLVPNLPLLRTGILVVRLTAGQGDD
jgi:hypothetical protein